MNIATSDRKEAGHSSLFWSFPRYSFACIKQYVIYLGGVKNCIGNASSHTSCSSTKPRVDLARYMQITAQDTAIQTHITLTHASTHRTEQCYDRPTSVHDFTFIFSIVLMMSENILKLKSDEHTLG